jgi:DNA invertase Pin-like site-specific DNA recombinase
MSDENLTEIPLQRPLVAYYRVSTQRQGASGLGLDAQKAAVKAYADVNRLPVVAEFLEVESGKVRERPQLERALAEAKRLNATLVVAKLDRLARDAAFVLGLKAAGVEFAAVDMPQANRFIVGIMALIAEYEGEQISARTRSALAAARKRGVVLGGFRGSGGETAAEITKRGRDRMLKNAAAKRAKLMPMIQAALDFADGNLNETARSLNTAEVPTPSGKGRWHARQIKKYLERGELSA